MSPESLQWVAPSPVWGAPGIGVEGGGFLQPWIAEFATDTFLTDFLDLMAGRTPGVAPPHLGDMAPDATTDGQAASPYRLFQPLHQRYYLVTASLVCRRVGIPDREVHRGRGERTSFVLRRVTAAGGEQAWLAATSSWADVSPGLLAAGEERLPMHPGPVTGFAAPSTTPGLLGLAVGSRRIVHYGYIPAARREAMVPPLADPVAELLASNDVAGNPAEDPRVDELFARVILPWRNLRGNALPQNADVLTPSVWLILDLGDWLGKYLPALSAAVVAGSNAGLSGAEKDLYDALDAVFVPTTVPGTPIGFPPGERLPPPPAPTVPSGNVRLTAALAALHSYGYLVTAGGDLPNVTYDMRDASLLLSWLESAVTATGSFAQQAQAAVTETKAAIVLPDELKGLIKDDPPPSAARPGELFVVRAVFEHDPCRPVLSQPSRRFVLAPAMDADAPARRIRIQLPDVANLRRFKRGVALEMPPSVRRIMDRVNPDMLKGGGLGDDPGVELGMICAFSLQIIFLVAFIVMFVFLILFNIIFWWMAFLKICFPIPRKK